MRRPPRNNKSKNSNKSLDIRILRVCTLLVNVHFVSQCLGCLKGRTRRKHGQVAVLVKPLVKFTVLILPWLSSQRANEGDRRGVIDSIDRLGCF